jgi:5-methylcytosine-specific restriction enzyme A
MPFRAPTLQSLNPTPKPKDNRESASKRGYGRLHQRWRLMILNRDPICRKCNREASTEADHIISLRKGGVSSMENGQGLCKSCHSEKTRNEMINDFKGVGGVKSSNRVARRPRSYRAHTAAKLPPGGVEWKN